MTALDCDLTVRQGGFDLVAAVTAEPGEVVALVGPNGAGKSTLLRALAGLIPARGRVVIAGADVATLPAHRRPVGWVPQDGALFPHLTALDNVAFGIGGRPGRQQAATWLDRLGVGPLAGRRPGQLSGGQAQKVALARALARRPRLLLLDEPLASLDVEARTEVRRALREHLRDVDGATLLVTHDPVDAATLAHRLVAVESGRIVQTGSVAEVTRAPRSAWLAALLGANAYRGRRAGTSVLLADGGTLVAAAVPGTEGAEVLAVVPAHAVALHRSRPEGSARNIWPVTVRQLAPSGGRVRVETTGRPGLVAEVTTAAVADLGLHEGVEVWASVKATEVTVVLL